jgi:hypothetical protein
MMIIVMMMMTMVIIKMMIMVIIMILIMRIIQIDWSKSVAKLTIVPIHLKTFPAEL